MKLTGKQLRKLFWGGLIVGLTACGSSPVPEITENAADLSTSSRIALLLQEAERASSDDADELYLRAIEEMLAAGLTQAAADQIDQLKPLEEMSFEHRLGLILSMAEVALQQGDAEFAIEQLSNLDEQTLIAFETSYDLGREYFRKLGNAYRDNEQFAQAVNAYARLSSNAFPNPEIHQQIWSALNQLNDSELNQFANSADNYQSRGWVELIRVIRAEQFSVKKQLDSVVNWQRTWSQHAAAQELPSAIIELAKVWEERPRHIALILPLQLSAGNAIHEGFLSAYYQDLLVSGEVPYISVYDSSDALTIFPLYDQAVAAGADLIIGPLDKSLVAQLLELDELPVTTLALNYTDETREPPPGLFQFGLAPEDEIEQAVNLAFAAGFKNAAVITPNTEDYLRLQSRFRSLWTSRGGELVSQSTFNGEGDYASVIKRLIAIDSSEVRAEQLLNLLPRNNIEFTPRRRQDIDFIFMIANPRQGRQIKPTLAFYYAGDIPVFSLPSIYDGHENQSADQDLNGIVFTDAPWVLKSDDPVKNDVESNLRSVPGPLRRLRALGVDSFRLYTHLEQLADGQIPHLAGATGTLNISNTGRIRRSLEVAKFENGLAVLTDN